MMPAILCAILWLSARQMRIAHIREKQRAAGTPTKRWTRVEDYAGAPEREDA